MEIINLKLNQGLVPIWIRLLIKSIVLYFIIYLEVNIYSVLFTVFLLIVAEITEVYAGHVVKKYPKFTHAIATVMGWMNIIVSFAILQFTGYLSSDMYALAFIVIILATIPSGVIGGLTNGMLSSALYILMTSNSLTGFDSMFRAFMFIAISTIIGILAESNSKNEKLVKDLNEKVTHKDEASDLKDNFLKLTHHSLRTPMTAIKGYSSALEDPDLNKEERDMYFHYMQDSIKTMNALIENVFSVLRVEEDFDLELANADIIQLIREIIEELSPLIKSKNATIEFQPKIDKLIVKIDQSKMKIALNNLIDNAIRYSDNGEEVNIEIQDSLTNISIIIKDRGQGIAHKEIPYLFEKFHRINVLTPDSKGLGIGLYYANRIIEKHNGKIDIKSKENQGTTVSITIPKATGRSLFEGVAN